LAQAILAQAKSQVSYGTPLAGAMGGQRALAVLRLPGGHMLYVNDELVAQRLVDRALPVCDASVAEHDLRTRLAVVEAGLRVQQELAHGLGRPVPVLSKAIQALRTLNSVAGVAKHQTEEEGGRPPKAEAAARSEGSAAPCGGRVLARHASEPEKEPGKQGERMDQENVMSQTMSENNGMHEYHGCGESTECGKHNGTFAENVTKEIAKPAMDAAGGGNGGGGSGCRSIGTVTSAPRRASRGTATQQASGEESGECRAMQLGEEVHQLQERIRELEGDLDQFMRHSKGAKLEELNQAHQSAQPEAAEQQSAEEQHLNDMQEHGSYGEQLAKDEKDQYDGLRNAGKRATAAAREDALAERTATEGASHTANEKTNENAAAVAPMLGGSPDVATTEELLARAMAGARPEVQNPESSNSGVESERQYALQHQRSWSCWGCGQQLGFDELDCDWCRHAGGSRRPLRRGRRHR